MSPGAVRHLLLQLTLAGGACLLLGGDCGAPASAQLGHKGQLKFSFTAHPDGSLNFANAAVAAGGKPVTVSVYYNTGGCSSPSDKIASARSSDPSVAAFTITESDSNWQVAMTGVAPGKADLEVLDAAGKVLDQITISVDAAKKVVFNLSSSTLAVIENHPVMVEALAEDAMGRPLLGAAPIQFAAGGSLVAASANGPCPPPTRYAPDPDPYQAFSFCGGAGTGSVTATLAGAASSTNATGSLNVTVVPAAGISTFAEVHRGAHDSSDGTRHIVTVDMQATAAGLPVYGALCNWLLSDGQVSVVSQALGDDPRSAALYETVFAVASRGSHSALCSLGAASQTVALDW